MTRRRAKRILAAGCLSLASLAALGGGAAPAGAACPNQGAPGVGFLPDCRAWEMVSPPEKNGGDIVAMSLRTRAAADGSALGFVSLAAFGDAIGTGIATDYISVRGADPDPGDNGWSTHAITPLQDSNQLEGLTNALEPRYVSEFSPELEAGVFLALSPLSADPDVAGVINFYRRPDLRAPGQGAYELVTSCPRCQLTATPLPPLLADHGSGLVPRLVGGSPDFGHIAFESAHPLTVDAPSVNPRLFEWEQGQVRLAGRIPNGAATSCDDSIGPACKAAEISIGGSGAGLTHPNAMTPHAVSDGSDGHSRVFFTVPTDAAGTAVQESSLEGNLYVRTDGTATAKLNASEREVADAQAAAWFLDAAADGSRAFFKSKQALTDDAPADGGVKLYMYDTTKAPAEDNLTFLSPDENEADNADVEAIIGLSDDGSYVYFIAFGQLVAGEPQPAIRGIYLWHQGELSYVGEAPKIPEATFESWSSGTNLTGSPRQARVTPDGKHLLFSSNEGTGLLSLYGGVDYDHGSCTDWSVGPSCRELYLYDAESETLQCVSCRPDGAPATTVVADEMASTFASHGQGGANGALHRTKALSDDGRYAFFSTAERLVPADTNGTIDAYLFDSATGQPHLLSSGESSAPSFFLDASADGSDVFFATREPLSAWDVGSDYDIYDARVKGGFPEPRPAPPSCLGDACQPAPPQLDDPTPGSASVSGSGNQASRRCPRGRRRVTTRGGAARCLPRKHRAGRHRRAAR